MLLGTVAKYISFFSASPASVYTLLPTEGGRILALTKIDVDFVMDVPLFRVAKAVKTVEEEQTAL